MQHLRVSNTSNILKTIPRKRKMGVEENVLTELMKDMTLEDNTKFRDLVMHIMYKSLLRCELPQEVAFRIEQMTYPEFDETLETVDNLSFIFKDKFDEIFAEYKGDILKSETCFSIVLKCCFVLCYNPSLFLFLLTCVFISRTIMFCFKKNKCYRILQHCKHCLLSLYKKELSCILLTGDDLKKLYRYCSRLNELMSKEIRRDEFGRVPVLQRGWVRIASNLIGNCAKIKELDFAFTDFDLMYMEQEFKYSLSDNDMELDNDTDFNCEEHISERTSILDSTNAHNSRKKFG
ncbi:hypothetical protein TNCT_631091 [Trichonephila clavata]|uniref:Uncharacterized protein n=1 Tax=Trichonephila clavata TaxID=2740835 RepID=A0A8X6GT28_TRICU|nr:hypothetical protein TNCT_631091 [Trichonephila clavata]